MQRLLAITPLKKQLSLLLVLLKIEQTVTKSAEVFLLSTTQHKFLAEILKCTNQYEIES